MKCLQKYNVFGCKLKMLCYSRSDTGWHIRSIKDIDKDRDCLKDKTSCYHHIPVYDEFDAWVMEERYKAGVLPKV